MTYFLFFLGAAGVIADAPVITISVGWILTSFIVMLIGVAGFFIVKLITDTSVMIRDLYDECHQLKNTQYEVKVDFAKVKQKQDDCPSCNRRKDDLK